MFYYLFSINKLKKYIFIYSLNIINEKYQKVSTLNCLKKLRFLSLSLDRLQLLAIWSWCIFTEPTIESAEAF